MADTPDVLFLVLDSLRKDRVSSYDHRRETTPALSRLADDATTYENAFTPAPWTLPSHSSMFTGKFPSEHGVTNGFSDGTSRLPRDVSTMTERLSARGYRTAGFSNNPWVGQLSGLDRGFDEYVEWDLEISRSENDWLHTDRDELYSRAHTWLGKGAKQPIFLLKRRFFTERLVERAKRWLERGATGEEPTFTFLNLMEAHSPYFPPKRAFRELGLDEPNAIEPRLLNTKLLAYVMGKSDLSAADRRRIMEYYDASARYQDRKVSELLGLLNHLSAYDDTLVVVCSDHGKTLGDYDRDASPPHYLRDINVNVPLFVKRPHQRRPERVTSPFELTTLHDVVLDGGHTPAHEHDQPDAALVEDFVPHAGATRPPEITRWRLIADGTHKYLRNDHGEEYLFDRERDEPILDPEESVLSEYSSRLSRRAQRLERVSDDESERELEGNVQSQLKDLGYM